MVVVINYYYYEVCLNSLKYIGLEVAPPHPASMNLNIFQGYHTTQ